MKRDSDGNEKTTRSISNFFLSTAMKKTMDRKKKTLSTSFTHSQPLFTTTPPLSHTQTSSQRLAQLLKEHCLVDGGDLQVANWMRDEGYDAPPSAVVAALDAARAGDVLFWAGRYALFVQWSPDGSHPWDASAASAVELEIGVSAAGIGGEATPLVVLGGTPLPAATFSGGVLRTGSPVQWRTPDGRTVPVTLELAMSTFFGYGGAAAKKSSGEKSADPPAYYGLQCHGVLWPADASAAPSSSGSSSSSSASWPITPPMVSGKVNVATRSAAVRPGAADALAAFAGAYAVVALPNEPGGAPAELADIVVDVVASSANSSTPSVSVTVGGSKVDSWSFDGNNVLSWEDDAGCSAWLQFLALRSGPAFAGNLFAAGSPPPPAGFNAFGQRKGEASALPPDGRPAGAPLGRHVVASAAAAGALLAGGLLRSALSCWAALREGATAEDVLVGHDALLHQMRRDFECLDRLHDVGGAAAAAFGGARLAEPPVLDLGAAADAAAAADEAAEHATAARVAADAASGAVPGAEAAEKGGTAVDATSKAAVAAWRASQAAASAAAAEAAACRAVESASLTRVSGAGAACAAACGSFNAARQAAGAASAAAALAAASALRAVEQGIATYAAQREYLKLKDIAEASDVAGRALEAARAAQAGWSANTCDARAAAVDAARGAAEAAEGCHRLLRAVNK